MITPPQRIPLIPKQLPQRELRAIKNKKKPSTEKGSSPEFQEVLKKCSKNSAFDRKY